MPLLESLQAPPLPADLVIPAKAIGIVLFAHGSGSNRHSPRNRFVAGALNAAGLATMLADLTDEAIHVVQLIDWLQLHEPTSKLPLGLFGASTGAAAALDAAALRPEVVRAVVSRGGRPDLARHLDEVEAPTLLLVGSRDRAVLDFNEYALRLLHCVRKLEVVSGATHLFEEPGTLERVAAAARDWFRRYLRAR